MNNERLTKFVLIVEVAAIIVLHVARSSSAGVRDIARQKARMITPATLQLKSPELPFKSPIVLSVRK